MSIAGRPEITTVSTVPAVLMQANAVQAKMMTDSTYTEKLPAALTTGSSLLENIKGINDYCSRFMF